MKKFAVIVAILTLSACAVPAAEQNSGQYAARPIPDTLMCMDTAIPSDAINNARPATELDAATVAGIEHSEYLAPHSLAEWFIGSENDSSVVLLRQLEVPQDLGNGDIRDFEVLGFSTQQPAAIYSETLWSISKASSCSLRIDLGGLGGGGVTLDPERLPLPGDTTLHLLVTEFACNSGQDAAGRVKVAELNETGSTVEIVVGISPASGGTCPSNPPTSFDVELAAPLGNRQVVDASVVPSREIG